MKNFNKKSRGLQNTINERGSRMKNITYEYLLTKYIIEL